MHKALMTVFALWYLFVPHVLSMVSKFSPSKQRLFGGKTSLSPPPDDIPLSQMDIAEALLLRDPIDPVCTLTRSDDNANKQRRNSWRFFCYFLHVFLVALHTVLLVISTSNHPEHRITLPFDNEAFTTGLSGGLQAFYVLYTALLVFVTQSLVLSVTFSSPKTVTQIHDICGAWSGLGAALSTLWSQTKIASSVWSVVLVTVYFACVSVLHVASSTMMQLQPFNETVTRTVSAVKTWPGPSVNLSALDWSAAIGTLPFLQNLYGNATTTGLANNTLYDIPTQSFVNAMVNTTMVNAHCGLTNLSVVSTPGIGDSFGYGVNASIADMDFIIYVSIPPLLNEIWFPPMCEGYKPGYFGSTCNLKRFIIFIVSAALGIDDSDESANGIDPIYFNGSYIDGPTTPWQNISTPIHFVACTLNATTSMATLDSSSSQPKLLNQDKNSTDVAWSTFSPGGDIDLTVAISTAMHLQQGVTLESAYCLPIVSIETWYQIHAFEAYVNSLLGMGLSFCNVTSLGPTQYAGGAPLAHYTGTPSLLTRGQMEHVISQIAAQFIWLAGRLGSAGGGFDRQTTESEITQFILRWRLNINPLPVIAALCASVVLFFVVIWMLWDQNSRPGVLSSAGVLGIMWLGSRPQSQVLRGHLREKQNPSVDSLRASSMFETVYSALPTCAHLNREDSSKCYTAAPFDDLGTHPSSSGSPDSLEQVSGRNHCAGDLYKPREPVHTPDTSRSRCWCYALHIALVALHVVLLALLVLHPEHSVIIPIEINILTAGLSALLQAVYTLYSALLIAMTQRLALFRMVSERRKLTTVHDVSAAWTGIGAAIYVLWQQRQVTSSVLGITVVVTYLTSMLLLHIGSSSIVQWQVFNSTFVGVLTSDLALPGSAVNASQFRWGEIVPVLQFISLDAGVSTYGLSNNTLYDIPRVPTVNGSFLEASVNATTLRARCGLVPNLTMTSSGTGVLQSYFVNFTLGGIDKDKGSFDVSTTWNDFVQLVSPYSQCTMCPQTIFYVITTGIDVDDSVRDAVAVNLSWPYIPSGGNPQNSTILTHIAACSVSAQTVPATLDLRENRLASTTGQTASSSSTSWSTWSPGDAIDFSVGMATAMHNIPLGITETTVDMPGDYFFTYTEFDAYMMNLLGIDVASVAAQDAARPNSSANPSVMLTPSQLEDAVAQTIAKLLWISGQLGENAGGFQRTVGESRVTTNALQWRLNLNTIPVIVASVASFTALMLVPFIIGKKPSKQHSQWISGTSVLECLWLEAQSEALHSRLTAIEEPRSDRLRAAGMFDTCLGDTGRSSFASIAEVE